ncbi:MAG: glycosyltransferase [Proteobacteria bacterium]|nr:MAG: glycosyltransferase [Pseudomonadota bacterium]
MNHHADATQASPVNIICMKWGDKYGADYVNKLYGMVSRNLTIPFQMTCFTDDDEGITSQVNTQPLPSLDLPSDAPERGWNKLSTLQENLGGLTGEALFLDLDVVIVSNIDELFSFPAEFAIIKDEKLKRKKIGNSSVYRFRIGELQPILDKFRSNFTAIQATHRNEQAYLSTEVNKLGKLKFWPEQWCPSFKYHCMYPWPLNYFLTAKIPPEAKVIIFHGHPDPDEAIAGITTKWYRHVRPTKWIEQHWHD